MNTKVFIVLFLSITISYQVTAYKGNFKSLNAINGYSLNIQNAVLLGDTLIFLNSRKLPNGNSLFDLCFFSGNYFKSYDTSAFSLPKHVYLQTLYCAGRDTKGNIILGTNIGLVFFDGNHFEIFSPYDLQNEFGNNIYSLALNGDDIYISGDRGWLMKFKDHEFTFLKGNGINNLDSTFWIVFLSLNNHLLKLDNKIYFKLANKKIAGYDLDSFRYFTTDLDKRNEIKFNYWIIYQKLYNDKIFFVIDDTARYLSYYMIYDGNKIILDSSYKEFIAPNYDRCIIESSFRDSHSDWYYTVLVGDSSQSHRQYLFIDSNNIVSNWSDLVPGDDNFHKAIMNVLSLPDGRVFYATNFGGFIVYNPIGTEVEKTDELPTLYVLNAFPNPVTENLTVRFATVPNLVEQLKIDLYDYLGNKVISLMPQKIQIDKSNGLGSFNLDFKGINYGNYYLIIRNDKDNRMVPIMKF